MSESRKEPVELSTFAANLLAVIRHSKLSVNAWSKRHELTQTTINRIVTGKLDPTTSLVEQISTAIGLAAWQMFVPEINPQNPPVLREASDAERKLYEKLQKTIAELAELREHGDTAPGAL